MTVPEETSSQAKVDSAGDGAGMESLGFWWVILLLDLQSSGAAKIPPHQVNGLQGGSVSLPLFLGYRERVAKIQWKFQPPTGLPLVIAEFTDGKLERPNPGDRFGQRLEMEDGLETSLRITRLQLGDSGNYTARVRLPSAEVQERFFACRVYRPVAEPTIHHQVTSQTAKGCNVTLQCLVSGEVTVSIYQRMDDGIHGLLPARSRRLYVPRQLNASSFTFVCQVKNPVDFKTVSLDLFSVCPREGMGSNPAEKPPQQVNGRLGGSVCFPLTLPPTETVNSIVWSFRTGSGPVSQIAELWDGKLEWRNFSNRLGQRLEMADETTLRIRALEKEDSGVLKAWILFDTQEVHEQSFRLSVFEPLPDPQIRVQLTSNTEEGCNVTLQCLASEKGGFNISWKRGDHLCVLEEGSGCDWLSAEGTDLHLSWQPDSLNSTFTCLLSSPLEQKNVSFDLLSICQREGCPGCLSWVRVAMLAGLLVQILTVASLNILDGTGPKRN